MLRAHAWQVALLDHLDLLLTSRRRCCAGPLARPGAAAHTTPSSARAFFCTRLLPHAPSPARALRTPSAALHLRAGSLHSSTCRRSWTRCWSRTGAATTCTRLGLGLGLGSGLVLVLGLGLGVGLRLGLGLGLGFGFGLGLANPNPNDWVWGAGRAVLWSCQRVARC